LPKPVRGEHNPPDWLITLTLFPLNSADMSFDDPVVERLKAALADRYQIQRQIGEGGMAVVFLAQDLKHDRPVAVKVLRPELSASIGAERFLREIQISAKLNHPHILTLIDSGDAAGLLYYVMPYVEGESLRETMEREGQLPLDEAFKIVREVADGLGYAHRLDIIHRDIKPENVLLSEGHAIVTDFGIAKAGESPRRVGRSDRPCT
jgi:serine/threonine protein kinase